MQMPLAVESQRWLKEEYPQIRCGSAMGNHKDKGAHVLGLEGLLKNCISPITHAAPSIVQMIQDNKMTACCFPQGVIVQMYREIAARRAGMITKVGQVTFADPRVEGGKMNELTRKEPDLNDDIELRLMFYAFPDCFLADGKLLRWETGQQTRNMRIFDGSNDMEVMRQTGFAIGHCGYRSCDQVWDPKAVQDCDYSFEKLIGPHAPVSLHLRVPHPAATSWDGCDFDGREACGELRSIY
jgi:acyl CoA:acetate/3-ketoacid CoA transferase